MRITHYDCVVKMKGAYKTMMYSYPAVFIKETDGRYSVIFPDLNGTATFGDTLEDAMAMAIDCMAGYITTLEEDGESIPEPSELSSISAQKIADECGEDYQDAFANYVAADVHEYARIHFNKAVRKTVTIPRWMNDLATAKGINFSQTLQKALRAEFKCLAGTSSTKPAAH